MALITVTTNFLKRLYKYGIRYVFFKFKNYRRGRFAIRKTLRRFKRKFRFKFIAIFTEVHVSFNGCRKKKLRRKRKRRFARRKKVA
jgi:ribosomal protein S11